VTTSHLPRGNPGFVDRILKENDMTLDNQLRCARENEKEEFMMRNNVGTQLHALPRCSSVASMVDE